MQAIQCYDGDGVDPNFIDTHRQWKPLEQYGLGYVIPSARLRIDAKYEHHPFGQQQEVVQLVLDDMVWAGQRSSIESVPLLYLPRKIGEAPLVVLFKGSTPHVTRRGRSEVLLLNATVSLWLNCPSRAIKKEHHEGKRLFPKRDLFHGFTPA